MYKDFEGVFSVENVDHISSHKDYDYVINPWDSEQLLYWPIYTLFENELSIFWTYIDKKLANEFIRLFKPTSNSLITFASKSNKKLRLYVNYQDLNNLTIKN